MEAEEAPVVSLVSVREPTNYEKVESTKFQKVRVYRSFPLNIYLSLRDLSGLVSAPLHVVPDGPGC